MRWWVVLAGLALGCEGGPDPVEDVYTPSLTCDPEAPPTMGDTPLRRLTRRQYGNAVRDLFAVTGDYGELLGEDEQVGTFASNSVTPVSQLVVEAYMLAAEAVARDADLGRLAPCNPFANVPRDCARDFVAEQGRRVLRHDLSAEEIDDYLGLYDELAERGHLEALRVVASAMLQSPLFLYHGDYEVSEGSAGGELVPLDPYALAARLSFFLWNTTPDDALLDAAASGVLATEDGLVDAALRLLADPRAAEGIGDLHLQWLGADRLEIVAKDPDLFPQYDRGVIAALEAETAAFADHVIRFDDGELSTLLGADYSVLSDPLFAFYGVERPDDWQPGDEVPMGGDRVGILTQASVLAAHAHYQRSSLTLRGKLVREELFCQTMKDPPPDVDITLPEPAPGLTTREAVAAHMEDPSCSGCHVLTDPLGFGFENYDAIGQWRDTENGELIDATGEVVGTDVDGTFDGPHQLVDKLVASHDVQWCVTRKWFRYALGRREEPRDACSVVDAFGAFEQPHALRELLLRIVTSDAFRFHRVDG